MPTQFYGIRHHGSGSARHLLNALHAQKPDLILLEAPPEAQSLLPLMADKAMCPPVALLAYRTDEPQQAVFYPFAEFSPEWQAIQYAMAQGVEVRFFDLPLAHSLYTPPEDDGDNATEGEAETEEALAETESDSSEPAYDIARFPFDYLAEIAGLPDGEAFWEQLVEQRLDSTDVFEAVQVAVTALREHHPSPNEERDNVREAYMRKMLRQAQKDANNVAVVCGAWHVPALAGQFTVKEDNALLKGLPKCKVDCTFIPWTSNRLTFASGYGAGVNAPAWYGHLWRHFDDDGVVWVSRVAQILREKGFDISASYVIETVRLANASASLRGQSRPRLADYMEAVVAVIGMGDTQLLNLVADDWLVGKEMGAVPEHTPQLPLIADVAQQRKKCRLPETAEHKTLELDLRKPLDLQRSIFIHRMRLLAIDWAENGYSNSTGTFKEIWHTAYQPEHHIQLTERAVFGNTLASATVAYVRDKMRQSTQLAHHTRLLNTAMPADLPDLVDSIAQQISNLSANNHDLADTLQALPDLANIIRYGSVRQIHTESLRHVLDTLLARLAVGGVQRCLNIDTDTAQSLFEPIRATHYALSLLNDDELMSYWNGFIRSLTQAQHVHPLLAGYAVRLLFEQQQWTEEQTAQTFSQSLSPVHPYDHTANWLEGFLYQSGTMLLIHDSLWQIINDWLRTLSEEIFVELLPLLRRTFSSFEFGERQQLGDKARQTSEQTTRHVAMPSADVSLNEARATRARETIAMLLGHS